MIDTQAINQAIQWQIKRHKDEIRRLKGRRTQARLEFNHMRVIHINSFISLKERQISKLEAQLVDEAQSGNSNFGK